MTAGGEMTGKRKMKQWLTAVKEADGKESEIKTAVSRKAASLKMKWWRTKTEDSR